ncbi:MAG: NUDIX hydrolase [Planctomycetota bacterium]|jgi:hypothetical protein
MEQVIRFFEGGSPAAIVVLFALVIAVSAFLILLTRAFRQGREISIWPPRIGPKPDRPQAQDGVAGRQELSASAASPCSGDQVAAICYRRLPTGAIEFLLVSTKVSHGEWEEGKPARWLFPKKTLTAGDLADLSALAENAASDEGGVRGKVQRRSFLQTIHHEGGERIRLWNYLLEVDESVLQKDSNGRPIKPLGVKRLWKWYSRDAAFRAVADLRTQGRHVSNRDELRKVISEADRISAM